MNGFHRLGFALILASGVLALAGLAWLELAIFSAPHEALFRTPLTGDHDFRDVDAATNAESTAILLVVIGAALVLAGNAFDARHLIWRAVKAAFGW